MRLTPAEGETVSEKVVVAVLVVALAIGLVLYSLVAPSSSESTSPVSPAVLDLTTTTAAPAVGVDGAAAPAPDLPSSTGSAFGSGVDALTSGATADELVARGRGTGTGAPQPPPVAAPTCPADIASGAYESVAGPLGDAVGQPLPADNLRVLAEIAAGCSAESATTPLIGLALDLGRVVSSTGVQPVDLSAIPAVEAPALPQGVIDALGPLRTPIQDGCANVGLLGVLLAVLPGAASVPVHGQELADAIVPAQTLCAQLEG